MADPIKDVLTKVIEDIQEKSKKEPAIEAWENAVDNQTRLHARPLDIKSKTLRIVVDSSAWLYNLNLKKKEILKKLKNNGLQVEDLNFRVGKVH